MEQFFHTDVRAIFERLKQDITYLEDNNFEWVGVFLQGSQNYGLDYENSDIDTKCIVLPTFEDIILNKKSATFTHIYENEEHLDVKDIRLMFDCFKKQNINFLEILFTPYSILNPTYAKLFKPMIDNNEKIAKYNMFAALNTMSGMALEKQKALTHPYPACIDKIEKWGYDPKQLHHIIRLKDFISRYINGEKYSQCLIPTNKEFLISVKRNEPLVYTVEEAIKIADNYTKEIKAMKDNYMENHTLIVNRECEEIMNKVLIDVLTCYFKNYFNADLKN